MWSNTKLATCCALAGLVAANAGADSMAVPTVELREEEPGRYQLEAQIARVLVSGAGRPVPPNRCSVGEPERDDEGRWIRLRYVIDRADEPLGPRDGLVLPWVVDGIQLTAYWHDG